MITIGIYTKSIEKKTIENISGESRWNSESEMKEMRFMGSSAVTPAGSFALSGNGPGSIYQSYYGSHDFPSTAQMSVISHKHTSYKL